MTHDTNSNIHDEDQSTTASTSLTTDPTPSSSQPTTTDRATVWLTPDQVESMRNAVYEEGAEYLQPRNEAIIALMYDTGLRVGELVALDTSMLRDNSTALYLPAHIQKDYPNANSPPPVTIELASDTTRTLQSFIASRWKETDALFPSRKADRLTTQGVRYIVADAAAAAGIEPLLIDGTRGDPGDVTPHALRHSVAYRMLHVEDGYTLYDVRNRLRHSSIQTTETVYDHFLSV